MIGSVLVSGQTGQTKEYFGAFSTWKSVLVLGQSVLVQLVQRLESRPTNLAVEIRGLDDDWLVPFGAEEVVNAVTWFGSNFFVHLVEQLVVQQVLLWTLHRLESFAADVTVADLDLFLVVGLVDILWLVPSTMRGQICRTIEDLFAFRATIFNMNNHGTPVYTKSWRF